jgi:putative DNA primase/helicase
MLTDSDPLESVLAHLVVTSRRGDKAECLCPAHDDRNASLSVTRGFDQPVVLHCHAGCDVLAILTALGLTWDALTGSSAPHIVASYVYTDAAGQPLYYVDRWVPKAFRPRLPDGTPQRPSAAVEVLYRLPDVLAAVAAGRTVYVVEGEKDAEVAREFGLVATTSMSGASQPWLPQFTDTLMGAHVVIVADADQAGRTRARRLVDELRPYVAEVRAVIPRWGKDLSDHLWAGYKPELLDPLPAEGALVRYGLDHVDVVAMTWAWRDWVPAGMLSLIEGEPGDGKSVLTCDLAARWTTGKPMPDDSANPFGGPVRVGMVSAEDDPARVIKPRIVVAGGDPRRITVLAGMPIVGTRYLRNVDLESDIEALREAINADNLRVLILDPLMAYLGSTRTAIDSEVRKVLTPLKVLAEETDCAIVAVRHLRKAGGKAVHAGGGSIAFTGQARSVMMVGPDHSKRNEADDDTARVFAMTKTNVGKRPTSRSYWVVPDAMGFVLAPRVSWDGESALSADDLMRAEQVASREVVGQVTAEVTMLLATEHLTFDVIRKRVNLAGTECTVATLKAVLKAIAIEYRDGAGTSNRRLWRLKPSPDLPEPGSTPEPDKAVNPQVSPTVSRHPGTLESWEGSDHKDTDQPDSSGSPDLPQIDADAIMACAVCGNADPGLLYVEGLGVWRCEQHPPELPS